MNNGTKRRLLLLPLNYVAPEHHEMRSFEMTAEFTQFQVGDLDFVVEPLKSMKTLKAYDFDAAYARAEEGVFNNIQFKVIHAHDLLREKEAN